MKPAKKYALLALATSLLIFNVAGCKKAEENSNSMSPGSSGTMSSSAAPSGVSGQSDAAKQASDAAAASPVAPASEAPVIAAPTGASQ